MDSKYSIIENGNKTPTQNWSQSKRKHNFINNSNGLQNHSPQKKFKHQSDSKDSGNNSINSTFTNSDDNHKAVVQVKSIIEQRKQLPVFGVKTRMLQELMKNSTIIVIGETGSGKTTQIPQFLEEETNLTSNGIIAVTQPRRVAAITIAKRVAIEKNCRLGDLVGYTVRFEDVTSKNTKIKYMTDGSLLREALSDRLLKAYRVIILDEAHERTTNTDVLFGIVKEAQKLRKDKNLVPLKIIIMSATMDVDHFSSYFNNCSTIYLEGRTYNVRVMHTKAVQNDYQLACVSTFFEIHRTAPPNHDVLIFLTGQEEIEAVAQTIRVIAKSKDMKGPIVRVFPLYSQLPQYKQLEVFLPSPHGSRKVVLATNIAETSLTISGIRYVIDSGVVKRRVHDSVTGMDSLKIVKISQSQACQRLGRAGRESEGTCYRVYTSAEFQAMPMNTVPEILRSNITSTVLQLLALGIDCQKFDFMDKPDKNSIECALKQLHLLGALSSTKNQELTALGKLMSKFPLDPKFSKILLESPKFGCVEEMLSLVALLSGEQIFHSPNEKREMAAAAHVKFQSKYGDHLTFLTVFRAFDKTEKTKLWSHENFLNYRNLQYAKDVRSQLLEICQRCDIPMSTCGSNFDQVRKCLITGLFTNIAELQRDNTYITLTNRVRSIIHPSSVFTGKARPNYILFNEIVSTGRNYLRLITEIEPEWIEEIVPNSGLVNKLKLLHTNT